MNEEELLERLSKYPEKTKVTRTPFGYIRKHKDSKEGDPNLLIPDPAVIPFLDQALDQLDAGISLRQAMEWLNSRLPNGVLLSHQGLKKLRAEYRPNFNKRRTKPSISVRKYTKEEILERRRRSKLVQEKKKITHALKRQAKLEQEIGILQDANKEINKPNNSLLLELDYSSKEYLEATEEIPVVFKPNPGPQTAFFAAEEQEVLYGGSAGGGKSYALIADPMRYFDNPNFRGLILRRTNDELRELIQKSQELYTAVFTDKGAKWNSQAKEWVFKSGARLWMTYLEREDDVHRYQGQSFCYIGFDELTQYPTPYAWNYMRSRLRTTNPDLPLFMRATSNPGGIGHGWVKRMFIDPAPWGTAFDARDPDSGKVLLVPEGDDDFPRERWGQALFKRRFIPAKLSDNPYLSKGGAYKANLLSMPEHLQRQLLHGDWDVAEGAAFPEFRQSVHVVEPFEIPSSWRRFRSCDYGYSSRQWTAVHWYAIDPATDQLVVYRELYINGLTGTELGRKVLSLERGESITYGVLDSSLWSQRGQSGPSIAEEMINTGCRWRPSDRTKGSRVAGKNRLHQLLRIDPVNNQPGIVFFNTCRQIISDLPVIPNDTESDDIDIKYASDHAYDSIRYGIMTRPRANDEWRSLTPINSVYRPADTRFGY